MSPSMTGMIGFAVLIILMFLRMPVGFVMALVGYLGFGYVVSWSAASNLLVRDLYSTFSSYNLTVIPLFVLMGQVAFHSGISGRLFNAAHKFFGHLPGGLAIATIGACAGFSAVCGSTSATAATMASVALPEMKKYKYDPALATGVVAAGGSLGILTNGDVTPCCVSAGYRPMTVGNLKNNNLNEIMNGSEFKTCLNDLSKGNRPDVCHRCRAYQRKDIPLRVQALSGKPRITH